MIITKIDRFQRHRSLETGLITHFRMGITATDDQNADPETNSVYREKTTEIAEPVAELNRRLVNRTKLELEAEVEAAMSSRIDQKAAAIAKQNAETIEDVSFNDLPV